MLPFVLARPLLRVSASVLYIHIQVQDTVYELMDFKLDQHTKDTTYIQLPIEIII
jgi:hypothetical protein